VIYKSLRIRRCVDNRARDWMAIGHRNPSVTQSIPYFVRPPKKSSADLAGFVQCVVASYAANVHNRSTSKTAVAFVKRHLGLILSN
jgi:hypothetical protein